MLQDFITSALVVDDDKKEVESLMSYLDERDVWTKYYHPEEIGKMTSAFNNRKLIFLDLYLDDSKSSTVNIAQIRKYFDTILGSDFGTYGIVLWTKHVDHFGEFCEKIFLPANKFTRPLFAVSLDKSKYLAKGNFEGVLDELEEKLKEDVSSSLFIEWNKSVKLGSDNTIRSLYNLFESNDSQSKNLEPVLYSLACNYTGIPKTSIGDYDLQNDLIKSLMDPLQFEISNGFNKIENLFADPNKMNFGLPEVARHLVYSKLNTLLMLDFHNLSQKSPIPGNIYEIANTDSPLFIKEAYYKEDVIDIDTSDVYEELDKRRICIEITPPCDFSLNKKQQFSRIIGGIQMDYNKEVLKGNKGPFKGDNYYTFLYPINITGFDKPQMIIFDFYRFQTIHEEELTKAENYKIIYRAKDKLFADILQKLSSHTARLGIGVLQ